MDRRNQKSPENQRSTLKSSNLCGWGLGKKNGCDDKEVLVALVKCKKEPVNDWLLDCFKKVPSFSNVSRTTELEVLEVGNVVALPGSKSRSANM
jgi:hypothetical protein